MNAEQVYKIIEEVFVNEDTICDEYILYLVGFEGYYALIENDLIEKCGEIDGRSMYVLRNKNKGK